MGFGSLFRTKDPTKLPPPPLAPPPAPLPQPPPRLPPPLWPWPSCRHPRTQSFRATAPLPRPLEALEEASIVDEDREDVNVKELRSDRLFFDSGSESSSILPPREEGSGVVQEMEVESSDPYVDFRASMEEVVAALGVRDWEGLGALLGWYLSVNGKAAHVFILGAFVDLLMGIACSGAGSSCNSRGTSASCRSSPSSWSSLCSCSCSGTGFSSSSRIKSPNEEEEGEEDGIDAAST